MTRPGDIARALRVGLMTMIAVGLLVAGIWVLGAQGHLWSAKESYTVKFRDVQGLAHGSAVSVAGYRIGAVRDLVLPADISEGLVTVVLSVERRSAHYLRSDTTARIKTLGLLGDRYIDLLPGTASARVLEPGSEITAIQPPDLDALLARGESVADNLVVLSAKLRRVAEKIERGEGFLGRLLTDSPDGHRLEEDARQTLASLRSLVEKVDRGEGPLALLVNDAPSAARVRNAIAALTRLTRRLDSDAGLLPRLFSDPALGAAVVADLEAGSREFRELAVKLNRGDGLLSALATDPALSADVQRDVRAVLESAATVSRRVADGEGSLGMIIQDDTLYLGLNDLLAGSRKSWLTRWFIARSQKQGVEERLERERLQGLAAPPPGPVPEAGPR